jgi:beta-lactamase regulating signal transducer with metallopeptidase domain
VTPWLLQLLVGSIGLVFTALLARVLLAGWKREPLASYRLLRVLLAVALVLPLLQLALQGTILPGSRWLAARLASVAAREEAARTWTDPGHPVAARTLSADELERISFSLAALEDPARDSDLFGPEVLATLPEKTVATDTAASAWIPSLVSALGLVYLMGVALRLVWTCLRIAQTKRLLERARPVRDPAVLELWREIRGSSSIAARVELLSSSEIRVPMCSGVGRPVILLPAREASAPSPDVLRCVLLHELVHLERRDGWVVFAQELLQAPFWFHPAARWLSRHLDLFRELSCDARVALRTGYPKRYAAALVEYAEWMQREIRTPHATSAALVPWTTTHGQLSRRIEMLLNRSTTRLAGPRRFLLGGAYAFLPFVWGSQLALASCLSHAQGTRAEDSAEHSCEHGSEGVAAAPAAGAQEAALARTPEPAHVHAAPQGSTVYLRTPAPAPAPAPVVVLPRSRAGGSYTVVGQDGTPMIGIELGSPDEEELEALGREGDSVLAVARVLPGSLAERSGIEDGDILVEVEGEPATLEQLNIAKRELPGGQIVLEIVRDGEERSIVIDGHHLEAGHGPLHVRVAPPGVPQGAGSTVYSVPDVSGGSQEALERAREALERALEAQPDNEALREAMEALAQARTRVHIYTPGQPMELTIPAVPRAPSLRLRTHGDPGAPPAPSAPPMAGTLRLRRSPDAEGMGEEIRRKVEEACEDAARSKVRVEVHGSHGAHADSGHREQELQELRALLEERRRELEELRARLEALRSERSDETLR